MAKGSRLDRIIEYFKSASIEEAKYVYQRAGEIVSERQIPMTIQKKLALGGRKKRRTKAEMAAVATVDRTKTDGSDVGIRQAASAGE